MQDKSLQILSDIIIYMKYARYDKKKKRRETYEEIVDRNKAMHIKKFPKLKKEIEEVYRFVYDKKILPSMRSFQFAGKPIEITPTRLYNCCAMPMNHTDAFSELMFLLLCGVGVGYSVQLYDVKQLPDIIKPKKTRRYLVGDSIEGWSDVIKVLIESYTGSRKAFPLFDYADVREKGAHLITSGGRAPGPIPLRDCVHNINNILSSKTDGTKLTTLEVHDINCFIADAVLAGGIRRSAMIALCSFDDPDMVACKFGKWYEKNPQRGRSNNSIVMLRHRVKEQDFKELWKKIELSGSGEPGIMFSNDKTMLLNPCAEISLRSNQFCNLVEINVSNIKDQKDLNTRSKAASFLATMQAGYTNFHYLREEWQEITEKEALVGVSMTGIASGKLDGLDLKEATNCVVEENKRVAVLIGINTAARLTTVKPSGTSSSVLGTSSGIHSFHSPFYIRRLRVGKNEAIYKYLAKNHPELIEDEFFKPTVEAVISIPVKAPKDCITRKETALQLLERVKKVYRNWIVPGHIKGNNTNNISVTVSIRKNEWDRVGDWMWLNKENFTAISVLPYDDHSYVQAPFEEIDEKTYNKMFKHLTAIDLTKIKEDEDDTNLQGELACGGGNCEIV